MALIRSAISLIFLGLFIFVGLTVNIGERTLFGHVANIWESEEAQELVDGVKDSSGPLVDRVKRGVEAGLTDEVAVKATDQIAEEAADQIAEEVADQVAEEAADQIAEKVADQVAAPKAAFEKDADHKGERTEDDSRSQDGMEPLATNELPVSDGDSVQ